MHSKLCKNRANLDNSLLHQEQVLFMNTVLSDCLPALPRRPQKSYIMLLAHIPEQDRCNIAPLSLVSRKMM